ncbi:MAG: response regulator [Blautia sp.]|nr:response regulator [Blautia sp.]
MRIVVAENEQRARDGICRLICSIEGNYEVVAQASNGETALELIEQLAPDVVFTDIRMPYMDGIELIEAVRERRIKTEFAVISAHADFQLAQKCISLDVTEYILKPVTKGEMEKVLLRLDARIKGQNVYPKRENESLRQDYPEAHPMVLRALDIIEKEYNGRINQSDLAETLGISPQYFSYIFSKYIGEGFAAFLKKYRIRQALKIMDDGEEDMTVVAYQVGFSDVKYFYKVFREVTGKNISEYKTE